MSAYPKLDPQQIAADLRFWDQLDVSVDLHRTEALCRFIVEVTGELANR